MTTSLRDPAAAAAKLSKEKLLATYSPPLASLERNVLWGYVVDPVYALEVRRNTGHIMAAYDFGYSYDSPPPRDFIAQTAAELEAGWHKQDIIDEKINALEQAVNAACRSLGLSDVMDIYTDDDSRHLFVDLDEEMTLFEPEEDDNAVRLVLSDDDETLYSSYLDLEEYDTRDLSAPIALNSGLTRAILGLVATHPEVAPFVKPFEEPPLPFTLALCEDALSAPADQMPAAARQWVLLHLDIARETA